MTALPLNAIKIGSRFRQDHGDIPALARSIEAVGLLHPVVVTPSNELVCRERRIEAVRLLGWQEIPVRAMTKGRIDKKPRQAEQLRKKRQQTAGVWLTAAKVPPRPIVVSARRSRAPVGFVGALPEPLPAHSYPAKRAQLGKPQTAGDR